jgi:hypothetical protein
MPENDYAKAIEQKRVQKEAEIEAISRLQGNPNRCTERAERAAAKEMRQEVHVFGDRVKRADRR